MTDTDPTPAERAVVWTVASVQLVNILDFVMVMPLGPDFAAALGIPMHHVGIIGGAYTASAAISGLVGSLILDRFERRRVLLIAMLGLFAGTLAGAFATGLWSLVAARVLAGAFGGPATSTALSMIADVVPPARRGRAMAIVMSSFSLSAILGVPAGLELARLATWRAPFCVVALLGLGVAVFARWRLPPMTAHLAEARSVDALAVLGRILRRPTVRLALCLPFTIMVAVFLLVPNLSTYVQFNLHYPREHLGLLYLAGGTANFLAMRVAGRAVDRFGSTRVAALAVPAILSVFYFGFVNYHRWLPVLAIYVAWMFFNSFTNVAYNTLISRVPPPSERARFMSLTSAMQHIAAASGALLSSRLLYELPGGALGGMSRLALLSMFTLSLAVPLLAVLELWVRRGEAAPAPLPAAAQPS